MLRKTEHGILPFLKTLAEKSEARVKLLVCVSGGADSMALLHILKTLRDHPPAQKELVIELAAVHFNHERRGAESDADAELVISTCRVWGIPLCVERWSETHAVPERGNFQEHARQWRYQRSHALLKTFFPNAPERAWILTAHHARDNAESILLNIVRGTGLEGLQGIAAVNAQRRVARPLLTISPAHIRNYVLEAAVPFREDSSNATTDYTRNLLRHKVLPILSELNPHLEAAFTRLAHSAQSTLAEIHVPDGPLPLSEGMSTTQILKLAKNTHPELANLVTTNVLNNILHHVRLASRRRSPVPSQEIPLANGWVACIADDGLSFFQTLP